jgi:hypothetical protein
MCEPFLTISRIPELGCEKGLNVEGVVAEKSRPSLREYREGNTKQRGKIYSNRQVSSILHHRRQLMTVETSPARLASANLGRDMQRHDTPGH